MEATHTVFADFPTRPEADRAISALDKMGYSVKDISVIAKESTDKTATTTSVAGETAKGALGGATTGGVIGGVVPALAGFLIGRPIAAVLGLVGVAAMTVSGVVTGAVAGGLLVPSQNLVSLKKMLNSITMR